MNNIEFLNSVIRNKDKTYQGPKKLYKYRPFDEFSFDMFEKEYLYLCAAERLDDPTECITTIDVNRLMDLKTNNLKRECVEQIIQMIKPYSSEENFEMARNMIYSIMNPNGTVRPNFMLDVSMELQQLYPNVDMARFVNYIVGIPDKLDDPSIKPQMESLIRLALTARQGLGICSLAESSDIDYMWKNYADNSSGYCVEYEINEYELNKNIFPVIYDDNRQTNVIIQLVGNFIGQIIRGISQDKIKADVSQYIRLFLTKSKKWEYQREWRLLGDANTKVNAPIIKKIIVGSKTNYENKAKIVDFAEKRGIEILFR